MIESISFDSSVHINMASHVRPICEGVCDPVTHKWTRKFYKQNENSLSSTTHITKRVVRRNFTSFNSNLVCVWFGTHLRDDWGRVLGGWGWRWLREGVEGLGCQGDNDRGIVPGVTNSFWSRSRAVTRELYRVFWAPHKIVSHSIILNTQLLLEHAFCRKMFAVSDYVVGSIQESFIVEIFWIKRFRPGWVRVWTRDSRLEPFHSKNFDYEWLLYTSNHVVWNSKHFSTKCMFQ